VAFHKSWRRATPTTVQLRRAISCLAAFAQIVRRLPEHVECIGGLALGSSFVSVTPQLKRKQSLGPASGWISENLPNL
jgi:hypothetical protein